MNQQEPDPIIVMLRLDTLARSCGWIDRYDMKQSVLKSRGLTPQEFTTMRNKTLLGASAYLRAKYSQR